MPDSFPWSRADPLARVGAETRLANAALRDYAAMGPGRSLDKLLDRYRSVPDACPTKRRPTLHEWSVRYAWQARVEAVDVAYRQQLAQVEITERLRSRRARIRSYEAVRNVALEALPSVRKRPQEARLGDVARAVDTANAGLAREYGDDPLTQALALLGEAVGDVKLGRIAAIIADRDEE